MRSTGSVSSIGHEPHHQVVELDLGHAAQQVALVGHVGVQRGCGDTEVGAEPAQGDGLEARCPDHLARRLHDSLAGERLGHTGSIGTARCRRARLPAGVALRAARRCRGRVAGWRSRSPGPCRSRGGAARPAAAVGLDAFGHRPKAERVGQGDDGGDDGRVARVARRARRRRTGRPSSTSTGKRRR